MADNGVRSLLKDCGLSIPDYKNSNLSVINDLVGKRTLKLGEKEKKIFLIVDGLGYDLIEKMLDKKAGQDFGQFSSLKNISTVFPSTTTCVISSFETGLMPSEHGIVGWHVYAKDLGMVVMPYFDAPSLSKNLKLGEAGVEILPDPLLLMKAAGDGNLLLISDETLGNFTYGKVNCVLGQYATQYDLMIQLRNAIRSGKCDFIYVYYPTVDHLEHIYGKSAEAVRNCIISFFNELSRIVLPDLRKSDYDLIITSDHGQIEAKRMIEFNGKSEIMRFLVGPLWGDSRVMFMNVLEGKEDSLRAKIETQFGKDLIFLDSESAIGAGIFGSTKAREEIRYRFGTHMLIASGDVAMAYKYPHETVRHKEYFGFHSGLSEAEMRVPLMLYE